ncbi:helix-turn-helix transcriptional regulator [Schaalia sp. ZJ1691]|uniref:helix-turn-helix transcriptional regulator n=1 Tax=Schaalia sp. ZJ1691 TaxID=2709404 RepID=UPI0013EA4767|nr:helix-turn-helix transcriptional regulator [Schaalia sp. ZJ1691]
MSNALVQENVSLSEIVAGNVRAEAARRGFTQKTLATAMGLPRATMSGRWNGRYPWSIDQLGELADIFGLSADEFFNVHGGEIRRTPSGGSHRAGPLRARRDSNPQPF